MPDRYLLDTGITGLLSQNDQMIQSRLSQAQDFFVPLFALAELEYGALYYLARNGTLKYLNRYNTFLAAHGTRIIYPDLATSHIYATIASILKSTGQLMQANDMCIAALAQQHTLTVLTRDSDFKRVQSLSVEVI